MQLSWWGGSTVKGMFCLYYVPLSLGGLGQCSSARLLCFLVGGGVESVGSAFSFSSLPSFSPVSWRRFFEGSRLMFLNFCRSWIFHDPYINLRSSIKGCRKMCFTTFHMFCHRCLFQLKHIHIPQTLVEGSMSLWMLCLLEDMWSIRNAMKTMPYKWAVSAQYIKVRHVQ